MNGNTIYLIVGRSGSGKTTIAEELERKYGLKSIQSYTTRPKRSDNETGHIFVSDEEFDKLTDMVAYTLAGHLSMLIESRGLLHLLCFNSSRRTPVHAA